MVTLEYVPLLHVQRDLYQVARGPEHVPRLIDELPRLDADGAARAVRTPSGAA